jgi:hypothetical protein
VILKPFWLPRSASSERRDRPIFPVLASCPTKSPVCFVSSRSWPEPISKGSLHMAQSRSALLQLPPPWAPLFDPCKGCPLRHFPPIGVFALSLLWPNDSLERGPRETVDADLVEWWERHCPGLQVSAGKCRQGMPHRCYPIYLICTAL